MGAVKDKPGQVKPAMDTSVRPTLTETGVTTDRDAMLNAKVGWQL